MKDPRRWTRRLIPLLGGVGLVLLLIDALGRLSSRTDSPARILGSIFLAAAILYYASKLLSWLWSRLLWRVRRRLVVTYLFVGLTPIVLFLSFGALAAFGVTAEAMSRMISVQVHGTLRQAASTARSIVEEAATLPAEARESEVLDWLRRRDAEIQAGLPGARLALRRGGRGQDPVALDRASTTLTASPSGERFEGVGEDRTPDGAPFPDWIAGTQEDWNGVAYFPPAPGSPSIFGTPSIRSLARGGSDGRPVSLLLIVPVSRALMETYHEASGLRPYPYFVGAEDVRTFIQNTEVSFRRVEEEGAPGGEETSSGSAVPPGRSERVLGKDQLGEDPPGVPYVVETRATNWLTGARSERTSFLIPWSFEEAVRQLLGSGQLGRLWRRIFPALGLTFIVLEVIALIAAILITRAVTGTVHELHVATERIDRGDFSYRARPRSNDQLGELATAFNDMSSHVESLLADRVRSERLRREVEIAAEVQSRLFPRATPVLEAASLAGSCRAAQGVAGDYYDFIEIGHGLVLLALGDVSGKGFSAALVMSNLQAALRAQVGALSRPGVAAVMPRIGGAGSPAGPSHGPAPPPDTVPAVAAAVNEQLCLSTDDNRYATLFLALYDDRERSLEYANAGHNAAVLVRSTGDVERLGASGTVVGAFPGARYRGSRVGLAAGDLLVVFSDGISEAMGPAEELFGEDRVARFVAQNRAMPVEELRDALFAEIDRWSEGRERGDDQTVLVLGIQR